MLVTKGKGFVDDHKMHPVPMPKQNGGLRNGRPPYVQDGDGRRQRDLRHAQRDQRRDLARLQEEDHHRQAR